MTEANQLLLITHILAGVLSLLLFWVPIFARKGSMNHKKFGAYYVRSMYVALFSGMTLAFWVMLMPQTIKPEFFEEALTTERISEIEWSLRLFWSFILFLGLFTFLTVRHATKVLRVNSHSELHNWQYMWPIVIVLLCGIGILGLGIIYGKFLFMIFGGIGMAVSFGQLRFCLRNDSTSKSRMLEHISSIIGSGIGAHTAFLTFGARQLLNLEGYWQVIVWVLPGIIGAIAISWLTNLYGRNNKKPAN